MAVPEVGKCAPLVRMYKGKYHFPLYSSNPVTVDWFVLGQCGKSGTSIELSRHIYLIYTKSWPLEAQLVPFSPCPPTFLSHAHSHHLPPHLGKCLLVYEPSYQPYMCTFSHTAATVSEAIPPSDQDTVQPSETGTNSRVLCRSSSQAFQYLHTRTIVFHDSLYHTSMSTLLWLLNTGLYLIVSIHLQHCILASHPPSPAKLLP
jgi:hypothetical protein